MSYAEEEESEIKAMMTLEKKVVRDEQGRIDRKRSMIAIIKAVPTGEEFWSVDVNEVLYGTFFVMGAVELAKSLCDTFCKVTAEKPQHGRKLVRLPSKETSQTIGLYEWQEA